MAQASKDRKNYRLQILILAALLSEVCYIVIAALGDLRPVIPTFWVCYGVAFVIYWFICVTFLGLRAEGVRGQRPRVSAALTSEKGWLSQFFERWQKQEVLSARELLTVGIVFGVLFRMTLLFTEPSLSDDIYRYLWDGKVSSHDMNPYQYAPQAEELSSLRDDAIYPKINHKDIPTIYPPVNQLLFWSVYQISPTVLAFKTAFFLFDLLIMLVLLLILRALSLDLRALLLYAWNPLVIVEISGSGHADSLGIFFLTLALFFLIKGRAQWSNALIALSFLTKFLSALLLPAVVYVKRHARMSLILVFIIIVSFFYLPFADAGEKLFQGLLIYSEKWRFNASLFNLIEYSVEAVLPENFVIETMIEPYGYAPDAETIATRTTDLALLISKVTVAMTFLILVLVYLRRLPTDLARDGNVWLFKFGWILAGWFFLLNPTVQPWYLCWLLPFLTIAPNRAWLLLTGLVVLSYQVLIEHSLSGIWQESTWVLWLEYAPFYLLLIFDANRARQMQKSQPKF